MSWCAHTDLTRTEAMEQVLIIVIIAVTLLPIYNVKGKLKVSYIWGVGLSHK